MWVRVPGTNDGDRRSCADHPWRHLTAHEAVGAYDRAFADDGADEHCALGAQPNVVLDADRPRFVALLANGPADIADDMCRRDDHGLPRDRATLADEHAAAAENDCKGSDGAARSDHDFARGVLSIEKRVIVHLRARAKLDPPARDDSAAIEACLGSDPQPSGPVDAGARPYSAAPAQRQV